MLNVIGAGVGRTGTASLQIALERLLGGPCYHMIEVFKHPEHAPLWRAAFEGAPLDMATVFDGYVATVDFPGAGLWPQMRDAYPDALVLLSEREDAATWWKSADRTIFAAMRRPAPPEMSEWVAMTEAMVRAYGMPDLDDADAAKAAYDRHNAAVRAGVPADRLVCWKPGDGWEPLCSALGVDVPDDPFPHTNSTDDFRAMAGLDAPPAT
jgi:hypothetical protein